jgi:hypothetical protein
MKNKLQPLRVPTGWHVSYNTFTELDPQDLSENAEDWWELNEDLLQLHYSPKKLTLDLGWYGGNSLSSGFFRVYLIQNQDWENPLTEYTTQNKEEIISKIEKLLYEYLLS